MSKTRRAKVREPGTITAQLKAAIQASGASIYKLAKDSGVPQPVLQRFMAGDRDIKLATVDKLAALLDLRLR
jgi:hypothetical protein